MKEVSQAASLLGRKSVEARRKKWGKKEFVRKMQEWGKMGGQSQGQRQEDSEGRQTVSIYKRGGVYWYKFMWQNRSVRESTKQGNDKVARQMEAAHRTSLAKGEVAIREKKPAPTLAEFTRERFEPWCRATASPRTWRDHYAVGVRAILGFQPLANNHLDEITSEQIAVFVMARQAQRLAVSTVNGNLRVLRRILGLAVEWGALESLPKIKRLPGERHREHVIGPDEEARYLAAAPISWRPWQPCCSTQASAPMKHFA